MRGRLDSLRSFGALGYVRSYWLLLVGGVLVVHGNLVVYGNPNTPVAWYGLIELIFGILVCVWYSTRVVDARLHASGRDEETPDSRPPGGP